MILVILGNSLVLIGNFPNNTLEFFCYSLSLAQLFQLFSSLCHSPRTDLFFWSWASASVQILYLLTSRSKRIIYNWRKILFNDLPDHWNYFTQTLICLLFRVPDHLKKGFGGYGVDATANNKELLRRWSHPAGALSFLARSFLHDFMTVNTWCNLASWRSNCTF